ERTAGYEVVQYRGQILPLIHLARIFPGNGPEAGDPQGPLQVLVYSGSGRNAGLVVDRILDIVETKLEIQASSKRRGILGSAVIQDRVTDLLDVPAVLGAIEHFAAEEEARGEDLEPVTV